jgi:ABC-type phosphate transport system substrate-binding protein
MKKMAATILCLLFWASSSAAQVSVIAHKSVPLDQIERLQLLDFYTGDIRAWSNGEPVVVFDLKPKGEVKKAFYNFLGKSSSRMKSIWMKRMLSGEGDPPEALLSEEEMIKKVAATPGAIGFVGQSNVTVEVKVLKVLEKETSNNTNADWGPRTRLGGMYSSKGPY